jgi:hypothetical protein
MPITIAGSGTITGISAGGLPDGVITTDDIAANAVIYAKIGTTEQGQLCKAWVNFNGTSTVAIRASYNVSSITDNGTGDYTVNFTTAMPDANYSISGTAARTGTTAQAGAGFTLTANDVVAARTSSACRLIVLVNAGDGAFDSPIDSAHVNVAIFR